MKKILITGGAGVIGMYVIKYLLMEGIYEITVLDLKNKTTINRLKKYRKRVNIIYGDVTNRTLMEALVKDHDYVIHLASVLPPLADIKKGLSEAIDYGGCENIIRAITYYNPKCHLFFASTTSIYKDDDNPSVKSKIVLEDYDYFALGKYSCEKLIKEKIKNYTIYRIPLAISNVVEENFIYNVKKDLVIDAITKEDAAQAFCLGIKNAKSLNRKTYNIASSTPIKYKDLLDKILEVYGLNFSLVFNRMFGEKNYYSPVCSDRDELDNLIGYRHVSIEEFFVNEKRKGKRKIQKILAKPFIGGKK